MTKHYRNIDFLKGLCIIIVVIEHSKWSSTIWKNGLFPIWDRFAIPCFMVISGFVYTKSFLKKDSIKEYYSIKNLIHKLFRYLIPFAIAYTLEILVYFIINKTNVMNYFGYYPQSDISARISILVIIKNFFTGGYGTGNYYTPVILQLVLCFPLLYMLIKKNEHKGLIISFFLCLLSEVLQYFFGIPNSIYRLLILRHMFAICFGIYISLGYYKKNILLNVVSAIIGLTYIIFHSYFGFTPFFFNRNWADVNFIACLFFAPLVALLIEDAKLTFRPLEEIGKASYHIYLTQMVYYWAVKKEIMINIIHNNYLYALFNVIICVLVGYLFYLFDNEIIRRRSS